MSQPDDDLAPRRPLWGLWVTLGGVVLLVVLAVLTNVRVAGVALAVHLAALGAWRLVAATPGPFGITVRSRLFDVAFLWLGAIGTAWMTLTADNL